MKKEVNHELKTWADNRGFKLKDKLSLWKTNIFGAIVRLIEKLYFGYPLFILLQENGIEHISHLKSVSKHLPLNWRDELYELPNRKGYREPLRINSVIVDLNSGAVKLDSGHILIQRIGSHAFLSGNGYSQIRKLIKFNGNAIEGEYIVLPKQNYYYHFLLEELPRVLFALSSDSSMKVLSIGSQPEFVTQILSRFGDRVKFVQQNFVRVEILNNVPDGFISLNDGILNVKSFLPSPILDSGNPKKLFILRSSEARRDPLLEESAFKVLVPFGFKSVDASKLSITEQINLFAGATHVVGFHGGAFSNIIFTGNSARILEIYNAVYRNTCFETISRVLDLEYSSMSLHDKESLINLVNWASTN